MIGLGQEGIAGIYNMWNVDNDNDPQKPGHRSKKNKYAKLVLMIKDLVYMIISFADDEVLYKLSRINKEFRDILLGDMV